MSDVMRYDEATARRIQALNETADVVAQRRRVLELLDPQPGGRIVDVGCGPGYLAREIAAVVGPGGSALGVDVSADMLALAAQLGTEVAEIRDGALPGADGAVATQVYEFVEDLPAALAELHRVLRPGGRVVILDTDWDSIVWHSSDPARMDRMLDGWRRRLADPHLPRTLTGRLRDAGFEVTHRETYAIFDVTGEEGSYSASQVDHLGTSAAGVAADEVEAWAADLHDLVRTGEWFFSLNRYLFVARA